MTDKIDNIIREYPKLDDGRLYKCRYTKQNFERCIEIEKRIEDYEKWKIGINFITNRKLKIGGKVYRRLGEEHFHIKCGSDYSYSYVLFTELNGIESESYIQETKDIKDKIQERNQLITDVICKINLLKKWEEYVVFEEHKYGIPIVYNNCHRENNCFGECIKTYYESCTCRSCENSYVCNNPLNKQFYKCMTCDYTYYTLVTHRSRSSYNPMR